MQVFMSVISEREAPVFTLSTFAAGLLLSFFGDAMIVFIPSLGNIWIACLQIVVLIAQIVTIYILAEKRGRLLEAREQWRSERQAECCPPPPVSVPDPRDLWRPYHFTFDEMGLKRCDTDSLN